MKRLLVIAGSDSSAGAGIQADLKTAQHFGVYVQTVVTAVTAQDTNGVRAVQIMKPALVRAQIEAALGDIGADAIKIGMLGDAAVAAAVADALEDCDLPRVLDPVLVSTSGTALLDEAGVQILKSRLLPRTSLLTPNVPETEALVGIRPDSDHALRNAMQAFALLDCFHVLFKGGHSYAPLRPSLARESATATSPASAARAGEEAGDLVRDVLADSEGGLMPFVSPRQDTRHTHGTGCSLATAIACGLAEKLSLAAAVGRAHSYVQEAIRTAPGLGKGQGPLNHSRNFK